MTLDSCSSVAGSIGNVLDLYDFAAYETKKIPPPSVGGSTLFFVRRGKTAWVRPSGL